MHREFWFGNENIHLLSAQAVYPNGSEFMVQMKLLGYDSWYTNNYNHFQVDSERSNYLLHVSGGVGNEHPTYFASYQNKVEFSTYDKGCYKNCAKDDQFSGWWINAVGGCKSHQAYYFNYNGPFDKFHEKSSYHRINHYTYQPTFIELKVRRL